MSLKKIDFGNSIRADDIQQNFDSLDADIKEERLRAGGYGIVEGFQITPLSGSQVSISSGVVIDREGDDASIKGAVYDIAAPAYMPQKALGLTVNKQGQVIIPYKPYSSKNKRYFDTATYQMDYPTQELKVYDAVNTGVLIRIIRIDGNVLTVDAGQWAGKKVNVEFLYTRNRMDTVFVHPKKGIEIEQGIFSSSVSSVNLDKYKDYFVVGLIEVSIDDKVTLFVHDGKRTYRSIYVDKNNVLYLNGKMYRDTTIYFSMPDEPFENDLYCDVNENKMYVYTQTVNGFEWVLVTGVESVHTREVKIFTPEENPADLQTFMFGEEELNYFYVPNNNQLEVIIDNAVLMSDQFDEVIDEELDKNNGRGFKLKNPLDRATHVEVRIFHPVQASPIKNAFQRTAMFTRESFDYFTPDNADKIFHTSEKYTTGEEQLEVFVDGKRLQKSIGFIELLNGEDAYGHPSDKSDSFQIIQNIGAGQMVTHKITKGVYSYDHVVDIIEASQEAAAAAVVAIEEVKLETSKLDTIVSEKILAVNKNVITIYDMIKDLDKYIKRGEKIEKSTLPADITNNVFKSSFAMSLVCDPVVDLRDVRHTDFIQVHLNSKNGTQLLIRDVDYEVISNNGIANLAMRPELISSDNTLYVTGIRIGQ